MVDQKTSCMRESSSDGSVLDRFPDAYVSITQIE